MRYWIKTEVDWNYESYSMFNFTCIPRESRPIRLTNGSRHFVYGIGVNYGHSALFPERRNKKIIIWLTDIARDSPRERKSIHCICTVPSSAVHAGLCKVGWVGLRFSDEWWVGSLYMDAKWFENSSVDGNDKINPMATRVYGDFTKRRKKRTKRTHYRYSLDDTQRWPERRFRFGRILKGRKYRKK